ncbi:endonuclease/exonuclease/phosphatase family protein [Roseospirillum parvum]|uniref:Metal-dependent hydrolase, endonuclease/exonuclease/phosphatase family n=1 Tax=Roseospirillum parvum TaxID=83401 RepID=A0A1G7WB21_9PROT|nr:endonuclease/exonuclease/phosphatase family protein [Roseospirillum parvum]SDG69054.1 Metal-dependent hydrolase, endonuclease/exonuclease/phosphatase family [Roseospirillum parvum]
MNPTAAPPPPAQADWALSVVTLNTWKGEGPYRRRLDLMADGLAALAPDVVLLQEAFAAPSLGLSTAEALAERLGLFAIAPAARAKTRQVEGRSVSSTSGLALLSRRPLDRYEVLELPKDAADGDRQALVARLATPHGDLVVVNTHLSHLEQADGLRLAQLQAILSHLDTQPGRPSVLLGGDMNCPPDGACLHWLIDHPGHPAIDLMAGAADPEFATHRDLPPESGRIDHLLLLPGADGPHLEVTECRPVLNTPGADGTWPSDHIGLLVRLAGKGALPP